jgi:four helix bundle protein
MTGARHYKELIVWQLADQLRTVTLRLTARTSFTHDRRLCQQVEDAVNSACRNIAEGFGGTDAEFANYLRYSRRSLNELSDGLRGALLKGHIQPSDMVPVRNLLKRLFPAIASLTRHLRKKLMAGKDL